MGDLAKEDEILRPLKEYTNIKNPAIWNSIVIVILSVVAYTLFWQDAKIFGVSMALWGLFTISIIALIQSWAFIPLMDKYELNVEKKIRGEK